MKTQVKSKHSRKKGQGNMKNSIVNLVQKKLLERNVLKISRAKMQFWNLGFEIGWEVMERTWSMTRKSILK